MMWNPPTKETRADGRPLSEVERIAFMANMVLSEVKGAYVARIGKYFPDTYKAVRVLAMLLAIHFWFRGLMRTAILVMTIYYPVMLAIKDLKQPNMPMKQVVMNFPDRVQSNIKDGTGKTVNKKVVTALVVGFFAASGFVLLKPSGKGKVKPQTATPSSAQDVHATAVPPASSAPGSGYLTLTTTQIDDLYTTAYSEGAEGTVWGLGLKDFKENMFANTGDAAPTASTTTKPRGMVDDNDEWSSTAEQQGRVPPKPRSSSPFFNFGALFSMSGLFSVGLLGKFLFDTGQNPLGRADPSVQAWDPTCFADNVQKVAKTEPYKLLMPAFSLYRLWNTIRE